MRRLWSERQTKPFVRVHQRIDEHGSLKPGDDLQSRPGIVSTSKKDHRRQQHIEYQTDLLWLDNRRDDHAEGRKQPALRRERQRKVIEAVEVEAELAQLLVVCDREIEDRNKHQQTARHGVEAERHALLALRGDPQQQGPSG